MSILFKNGEIITSTKSYYSDIRIKEEKITEIGIDLKPVCNEKVINIKDKFIIPGGVDPHTHFDLPIINSATKDDFESGTLSAVAGGTTTIIDFATPERGESVLKAVEKWRKKAEGKVYADYGFHLAVTWWDDSVAGEIKQLISEGITSLKVYLAYKDTVGINDKELFESMKFAADNGVLVMVHGENAEIIWQLQRKYIQENKTAPIYHALSRPSYIEGEGINRAITMARVNDASVYFVHVSSIDGLDFICDAIFRGEQVIAETCPQYLLLDENFYNRKNWEGAKWVISPPLRSKEHIDALWHSINEGLIKIISTDHCSFDFNGQKDMFGKDDFSKIPNGIPGVQDRLSLIYTYGVLSGKIDKSKWIELCCTNPAKVFGMYPLKGTIEIGSDADLVVWDPCWEGEIGIKTSYYKNDYNAYEGFKIKGKPEVVTLRGNIIFENGINKGQPGQGSFINRKGFNKNE